MFRDCFSFFQIVVSISISSGLLLTNGIYRSANASTNINQRETLPNNSLVSVKFETPGDAAPQTSVGGGVRGSVQFSAPGDAAPTNSVGGGVRGGVQFSAPGGSAPTNSVGGGVRGNVQFGIPGDAAPSSSVGGGARSDVSQVAIALLPPTKIGQTISPHPTFFVYLPPTSSQQVFVSLQDEQGKQLYQKRLPISGKGGIISFSLPSDAPALEIGQNYLWFFAPIPPDGILRPDNYSVTGWVKRVQASSTNRSFSSPIEQATALASQGIWYDTLKILATARKAQPDNATFSQEWKELLEQVGLNSIANQPIAEQL